MGTSKSKELALKQLSYEIDANLIQKIIRVPNLLPRDYDQIMTSINSKYRKQPPHKLQSAVIKHIMERFQYQSYQIDLIKGSNFIVLNSDEKWVNYDNTWSELNNVQEFWKIIEKIEFNFYVEEVLKNQMKIKNLNQYSLYNLQNLSSIRKPQHPSYKSSLNHLLLTRLFLKCLGSTKQNLKQLLYDFHIKFGKYLVEFVYEQKFQQSQLRLLTYYIIYMQRHFQEKKIKGTMKVLMNQFQKKCLQNQFIAKLPTQQYQKLRRISRCYLDQLYYVCVKEAQDPEIIHQQITLPGVKGFPITRVKQRSKYT